MHNSSQVNLKNHCHPSGYECMTICENKVNVHITKGSGKIVTLFFFSFFFSVMKLDADSKECSQKEGQDRLLPYNVKT